MSTLLTLVLTIAAAAQATPPALPYETLFYTHDGLRLEAYLYKPAGEGPFPLVVYNHGSTPPDQERTEWPAPFVARLLVPAGYAVLVPERRGYGRSEGTQFSVEIGSDRGERYVARMRAEAGDINAALDYVRASNRSIDAKRVAIMGWSFGGIVTTLAAAERGRYATVIVQAPGALNWDKSEPLRKAMVAAAREIRVPMHCAVAENDATTESARGVCAAAAAAGARTTLKIYPKFASGRERPGNPPGHALFGPFGVEVWGQELLMFLGGAIAP
ncbi:MAG: alpha/beta fold hydrolase [Cyanobacteria bacterium]|nr:alpha/beta fold hydrolase [Cyanobacteriota bacterium]